MIKYGDTLDVSTDCIPYIDPQSTSKRNDVFLQEGDIIIADTAEDETVGKSTEIYNVSGIRVVSGLHTIPCRPKFSFISKYLGFYLNSPHFHKQLNSLMQGVKVLSISKSNISETKISFPSKNEQIKIANMLSLLDQRITKQRELVENLKSYKRGLLLSLFPHQSEEEPRLRFGGYTTKWRVCKLSSLGDFIGGGTPDKSQSEYWNGNIAWISSSDLSEDSIYRIKVSRFITECAVNNSATKICPAGTLHIVSRVGVGKVAISNKIECTSQDFCNFINHSDNHLEFIAYQLKNIMGLMASQTQGTSIKGITIAEIKDIPIYMPSLEEQNDIVTILRGIDEKVNHDSEFLETLELIKTQLLHRLFI